MGRPQGITRHAFIQARKDCKGPQANGHPGGPAGEPKGGQELTEGPASGFNFYPSRDWGDDHVGYFREYREQLNEYMDGDGKKPSKAPVILIPGRLASGNDPVAKQIHEWVSLLHDNNWDYKVGYAQSRVPAQNVRGREKVMDRSWVNAVKRGHGYLTITYAGESGTGKFTIDHARIGNKVMSVAEIKEEIRK